MRPNRRCSFLFITVLAGAIVLSSGMPLMASSQQSGQSGAVAGNDGLPETPQPQTEQSPAQASQEQTSQAQTQTPSGAAGAKAAPVKGAPVAQPVGAAVAPVRQRGHRSLLIKVGLAAGAAIAVGTVVALSAKSSTRPPGTTSSAK